jgi:multidrug efflux pump subunit AcrA (membrane-fusion protein)
VWIVDPKSGTVSARTVDVRAFDADRVVVASGLNSGDVVVTAGIQALRPGQKVRLLETTQ